MDAGIEKPLCKLNMEKIFFLLTVPANFLPGLSSFGGFDKRQGLEDCRCLWLIPNDKKDRRKRMFGSKNYL